MTPIIIPYNLDVSKEKLIRFHLLTFAWIKGITLSDGDMNVLTYLGMKGPQPLNPMCNDLVKLGLFTNTQSVRNTISLLQNSEKIVYKTGRHIKTVHLSDEIPISNKPNTILQIQVTYAPKES